MHGGRSWGPSPPRERRVLQSRPGLTERRGARVTGLCRNASAGARGSGTTGDAASGRTLISGRLNDQGSESQTLEGRAPRTLRGLAVEWKAIGIEDIIFPHDLVLYEATCVTVPFREPLSQCRREPGVGVQSLGAPASLAKPGCPGARAASGRGVTRMTHLGRWSRGSGGTLAPVLPPKCQTGRC